MYSELLGLALADESASGGNERSVEELVDRLVKRRLELIRAREEMAPSSTRVAEWTADLIAHDVALIRLCERLGIDQTLTDASAPPTERDRLLSVLAAGRIDLGESQATSKE